MQVQPLGWEDPLEEEMATHCSIPAWKILWAEEPGGLQSMGSQESDTIEHTHTAPGTLPFQALPAPAPQNYQYHQSSFPSSLRYLSAQC